MSFSLTVLNKASVNTPPDWYQPQDRGLEIQLREKLQWLRSLDQAALDRDQTGGG